MHFTGHIFVPDSAVVKHNFARMEAWSMRVAKAMASLRFCTVSSRVSCTKSLHRLDVSFWCQLTRIFFYSVRVVNTE